MRLATMLPLLIGAVAPSFILYALSGGQLNLLALPLVFVAPFVWHGRRS